MLGKGDVAVVVSDCGWGERVGMYHADSSPLSPSLPWLLLVRTGW